MIQNEPNFPERAGVRNTQRSTIISFNHTGPMPIVRNKANSRPCPVGRDLGDEGRLCKTNPIWRGQMCETKPIRRQEQEGQVLGGKRVMVDWTAGGFRRNKANLEDESCETNPISTTMPIGRPAFPGGEPCEATQFRGVGGRAEYPAFRYSIIPPFRSDACGAKQSQFRKGFQV
jgi:hypothetical protein